MINIGDKVKIKSLNGSLESVKDAIDMKKNYDVIDIIEENRDLIEPYELKEIAKILGVTNITNGFRFEVQSNGITCKITPQITTIITR